jgi:hypothetical protein
MKIKRVYRYNLPETNSSSSHSIVIDTDETSLLKTDSPYWDLDEDEKGYIHIPGGMDFGQDSRVYNSVLRKIQYACGLLHGYGDSSGLVCAGWESLKELQEVIVEFTGCKGVIFDWVKEYVDNRILQGKTNDSYDDYPNYPSVPSVDHQSMDNDELVWESKESLKNFIFNERSLLFIDSDGRVLTQEKYDFFNESEPEFTASIDLGDPIGKIEFELMDLKEISDGIVLDEEVGNILQSIYFDYNQKKFLPICQRKGNNPNDLILFSELYTDYGEIASIGLGIDTIVWASCNFITSFRTLQSEAFEKFRQTTWNIDNYINDKVNFIKKKSIPGENFIIQKFKIISKEFGEL